MKYLIKNLIMGLIVLTMIVSCNSDDPSDPSTPPPGSVVEPDTFQISILSPLTDGQSLSQYSVISGECGKPGFPIVIEGPVTLYSICQSNYKWAAPITAAQVPTGNVTFNVTLRKKDLSNGSAVVTRNFTKVDSICENEESKTTLFANSNAGANGSTIPYKICTPEQFSNIRFYPQAKFQLAQDINFQNDSIRPISQVFKGEIDGRGFTLENIQVKDLGGNQTSVGLFKYVQNATIKNINLKSIDVKGYERVGIIAGNWRGQGTLENIKVTGTVEAITYVGGLIGIANSQANLTITNLKADIDVKGKNYVGGLLAIQNSNGGGFNLNQVQVYGELSSDSHTGGLIGSSKEDNTIINNTIVKNTITTNGGFAGGFIGEASTAQIDVAQYSGTITSTLNAENAYIGGFIGRSTKTLTIKNSRSVAKLNSGGHYVGGLLGRGNNVTILNSHSRGQITIEDKKHNSPTKFAGGLIGAVNSNASVIGSHSSTVLNTKAYYVGGLIGFVHGENSQIDQSYNTGSIKAKTSFTGGLVGQFKGIALTNSFSKGSIEVDSPTPQAYIGGVCGYCNHPSADHLKLYNTGNISFTNGTPDYVGGVFGKVTANTISQTFNTGNITAARSKVGGIAGYLSASLSESFSTGNISGTLRYIGGIAGVSNASPISDTFFNGTVTGNKEVGSIIGWQLGSGNNSNAYAIGRIEKTLTASDSQLFGVAFGKSDNPSNNTSIFYKSDLIFFDNEGSANFSANTSGAALTEGQFRNKIYFTNFNFNQNWSEAPNGFILPGQNQAYLYPLLSFLKEPNYGFQIPMQYSDNPLTTPAPRIFVKDQTLLTALSLEEIKLIQAQTPVTTVTDGSLELSLLNPAKDGERIVSKKLIHGECGISGHPVVITGDINLYTICQPNKRWAAVIDASSLPVGNITLNLKLQTPDLSQSSALITRILTKSTSLCNDKEAINGTFANSHQGADGETTPYLICHSGHFKNIAYFPDKNFELASDVDFSGNTITPIKSVFTGSLDGKGFSIKNYIIDEPKTVNVALFSIISNGSIKNVNLEGFNVEGYSKVSALAGTWSGTGELKNITLEGKVKGIQYTGGLIGIANTKSDLTLQDIESTVIANGNNYTGGLIGHIYSNDGKTAVTNLTLKNTVTGLNFVGGFIGSTNEPQTTLSNITQTGNVTSLGNNIGGLIGKAHSLNLTSCHVKGNITSSKMAGEGFVGGALGNVTGNVSSTTCKYEGTIQAGADFVGGLIGYAETATINNNQSSGTLNVHDTKYNSVRSFAGGIVGKINENSTMTNTSSTMTLNVESMFTGGLVGRFDGKLSEMTASYFTGVVNARTAFVGGVAGLFDGPKLEDTYSTAPVNVKNPTPKAYIGGLVGYANRTTSAYKNLYATGDVTITNGLADYVGGLVGYFRGGSLSDSYATGNVTGGRTANGGLVGFHRGLTQNSFATGNVNASFRQNGGLIGYLLNGEIKDSMALGDVTSKAIAGGLVGFINGENATISNSYAYGQVTKEASSTYAINQFGPIVGHQSHPQSIGANLYYLNEKYTAGHNTQGSGVNQADANQVSTYTGFDFQSTPGWRMPAQNFKLPGVTADYLFPIPNFIGNGVIVKKYKITGSINGLEHGQIELNLNGQEDITLAANATSFEFTTTLLAAENYTVSIKAHPVAPALTCTLVNATGQVGNQDVQNIEVNCPTIDSLAILSTESNLAMGSTTNLEIRGTLSNGQFVDVSPFAQYQSSDTNIISLPSPGVLNALASGSSTITISFNTQSINRTYNVFSAPLSASNLAWNQSSPHNTKTAKATWTLSSSANINSQEIEFYAQASCQGSVESTQTVAANVTELNRTDLNNQTTYSFKVKVKDQNNLETISSCSSDLEINLPVAQPVSNISTAKVWINGSLPLSSPLTSWQNPAGVTDIKIALGTSHGGDQIQSWNSIGTSASYAFTGLTNLTQCSAYYPSVKTVNQFGLESNVVTDTVGFRWDNTSPVAPPNLSFSGDANITTTPTFTWQVASDNCALRFYEMAIGTTSGGQEIASYKFIGNTTSYQAINGANGFNLNLQEGVDYYTSVRAVDYAGNRSAPSVSTAWQIQSISANLPDLILWLDSANKISLIDRAGNNAESGSFSNKVATWTDVSGSTHQHNFYSKAASSDPQYNSADKTIDFNGSAHSFVTDNHDEINLQTVTQKNITISLKTENNINNTQMIYEEGGTVRGMNIYISNGKLYCGFWNIPNDGDGAQPFLSVSTNIQKNSTYNVTWNFDYSNYSGANGPDGNLECIVNGQSIGTATTTTRIYPHSGGIGISGVENDTFIHTGAISGNGHLFRGSLHEVMITNQAPTTEDITTIHNYLIGKWSGDSLNSPTNLITTNNSKVDRSATLSWNPVAGNFNTDHYLYAIGTTLGGTEVLYWKSIGNVTSYQAISGTDDITLNLAYDTNYYIAIKAVDTFGNESLVATSDPWQVKDLSSGLPDMILWLDSNDLATIQDDQGNDANNNAFNGYVSNWLDKSGSTHTHHFVEGNAPYFDYNTNTVSFDGYNNMLATANHDEINTGTVAEKNITFAFSSSANITSRQVLYEEGGGTRGMNIYIEGGKLYCGFWNRTDDGDGAQSFISVNTDINVNSNYYVTWVLDYSNYTGPNGADGKLDCYVNSSNIGSANTTTRIFPHGGAIGMGAANGSSRYHDDSTGGSHNFEGSIFEVMITNTTPTTSTIHQLHSYLQDKWESN